MSYGTDTWMYDELRTGRMATGVELLAQACYRRLTTPRGTLDDGDDGAVYGLDLAGFIGSSTPQNAEATIPPLVEAELLKDDRLASVEASATAVTDSAGLTAITLDVLVTPFDEAISAFTLTLAVSAVTVEILGVTPA